MRNACRRHTGLNRGGFFLHMVKGEPNRASAGTTVSTIGAYYLLACLRHWCMGCLPFAEVLTVEDWRRSSWTPFPLRKSGDVKGTICSGTQYVYGVKRCPPTPFDIDLSTDYELLGIRSFPEVLGRSGVSVVGQILANYLAPAARTTDSRQ